MHVIEIEPSLLTDWRGPLADGIDPKRTALVVIDIQRSFVEADFPGYGPHVADIVPNINRLIRSFREAGAKIVFTRHSIVDEAPHAPPTWQMETEPFRTVWNSLRPEHPGHALYDGLDISVEDLVIDKYRYSAFHPRSSNLDAELRAAGIDTVVIVGTVSSICCESSARDADMHHYKVIFVADATAGFDDASHNAALTTLAICFANVKTTEQLLQKLG